jgi:hypothetical protein
MTINHLIIHQMDNNNHSHDNRYYHYEKNWYLLIKINLKIFQINRELYPPTTPKNQPLPKKRKRKKKDK